MNWQPGALLLLDTERFTVRTATREDVTEEFMGWFADPEVRVGMNMPRRRMTRVQAVRWVLSHNNRTKFMVLVIDRENTHAVGFFTISIDPVHAVAETAVVVGDHEYWGRNVVVEVRSALLDFLFDVVGVHKVIGRPHGRNFASIFNYKAMGFTCEATLRKHMRSIEDGSNRLDQLVFGIFKEEWQTVKVGWSQ